MQPIYTLGYGQRSIYEFIDLLKQYGIQRLVDIRSHPVSRWNPQFRKNALANWLTDAGIEYVWMGDTLGGKPSDPGLWEGDALNLDVLEAQDWFQESIGELRAMAEGTRIAIMCAELRPQSCHRVWMVGQVLHERGVELRHIDADGKLKTHAEVSGYDEG
jgi:uncharacterized protein (DUF488 family)